MTKEQILKEAEERIGFGIDILNGENELAEQVGTGVYIAYEYNHAEEEVWQFVVFDEEEKAKILAECWAADFCTLDDVHEYHKEWGYLIEQGYCTQEEFEADMKTYFARFEKVAAWDRKIRVGQNISSYTTVGYAYIDDFIQCLPLKHLRQFTAQLFSCSIITGWQED